jgi:hypothetical protein
MVRWPRTGSLGAIGIAGFLAGDFGLDILGAFPYMINPFTLYEADREAELVVAVR